jgi:hypothetical protein
VPINDGHSIAKVATRSTLAGQLDDLTYWLTKDASERIAAVEILRRQMFRGDDAAGSRLQRVVGVIMSATTIASGVTWKSGRRIIM